MAPDAELHETIRAAGYMVVLAGMLAQDAHLQTMGYSLMCAHACTVATGRKFPSLGPTISARLTRCVQHLLPPRRPIVHPASAPSVDQPNPDVTPLRPWTTPACWRRTPLGQCERAADEQLRHARPSQIHVMNGEIGQAAIDSANKEISDLSKQLPHG